MMQYLIINASKGNYELFLLIPAILIIHYKQMYYNEVRLLLVTMWLFTWWSVTEWLDYHSTVFTLHVILHYVLCHQQLTIITVTMLGKNRVLRKNFSDMAMINVPMKRRHENMKTSAVYVGVSQPLPNSTPFNFLHSILLMVAQSITSSASVLFSVLLPEISHDDHKNIQQVMIRQPNLTKHNPQQVALRNVYHST